MGEKLSNKENKIFQWIKKFQQENGEYPTYREIQGALNFYSINSVTQYIKQLANKGYLLLLKNRGYRLPPEERSGLIDLPMLGAVQAGKPNTTEEAAETVSLPSHFVPTAQASFLLQVRGNSMSDAGIHEGDMVIVDKSREAHSGDIVVALIDGGNTVKRLIHQNGQIYLKAESDQHPDIYPQDEWEIQGVVTGLWRRY